MQDASSNRLSLLLAHGRASRKLAIQTRFLLEPLSFFLARLSFFLSLSARSLNVTRRQCWLDFPVRLKHLGRASILRAPPSPSSFIFLITSPLGSLGDRPHPHPHLHRLACSPLPSSHPTLRYSHHISLLEHASPPTIALLHARCLLHLKSARRLSTSSPAPRVKLRLCEPASSSIIYYYSLSLPPFPGPSSPHLLSQHHVDAHQYQHRLASSSWSREPHPQTLPFGREQEARCRARC